MKHSVLLILLLGLSRVFAQEISPTIVTEQPGFYIGPYTVEAGNIQLESQSSLDSDGNMLILNSLLRIGIDDRFEFRLGWGGVSSIKGIGERYNFASPIRPGIKVRLWRGKNGIPGSSFRFSVGIPRSGSQLLSPVYPSPEFLWATRIPLWENGSLFFNAGMQWSRLNLQPTYQGALCFDFSPIKRFSVYAETYAYFRDLSGNGSLTAGLGVYYLIANNFQVDLSYDYTFGDFATSNLLLGLSYRLLRKRYRE